MFDVGLSEMLLIGIVALVVLGPERLPKAARMSGALLRRLHGSWSQLRNELEREVAVDELKHSLRETEGALHGANPGVAVEAAAQEIVAEIKKTDSP